MAGEAPSWPQRDCRMDWLGSGNLPSYSPREGFRRVSMPPETRGNRQPQAAELVHRAHRGESGASARRVDPRYAPPLVSAIMAVVISLAVSLVETIVRLGFTSSLVPACQPARRRPAAAVRAAHPRRPARRPLAVHPARQVGRGVAGGRT